MSEQTIPAYQMTEPSQEWADWTDEHLMEFEQSLFDDEVDGSDNWELRETVLSEMRKRGLIK